VLEQRPKKKQPKHLTQKSKKMINIDPIYQEWTIQRDRQQWTQDIEQRQKKTTKTLNTCLASIVVCLSELSILDK
jgi:hypothetical protein